jgi:hypothetical protein
MKKVWNWMGEWMDVIAFEGLPSLILTFVILICGIFKEQFKKNQTLLTKLVLCQAYLKRFLTSGVLKFGSVTNGDC